MSDIFSSFALRLEFHDGSTLGTCMSKGSAIGNLDRAWRGAIAFHQFARFLMDTRRVRRSGCEYDKGRLAQKLDELRSRLDSREVERAWTTRYKHQIRNFHRSTCSAIGVWWSVNDDEFSPLPSRLRDFGGKAGWRAIDDLRWSVVTPRSPLASGCLRIGIHNKRNPAGIMRSRG
jgi:hypothetical protein